MKKIEIDDELYQYIASNTQSIGESASTILRRLLNLHNTGADSVPAAAPAPAVTTAPATSADATGLEQSETATVATSAPAKAQASNQGSVFDILNKEELAMQKGVVGRFLFILAAFHRSHKTTFERVLNIKGRDRRYFATSKEELQASGSSLNPKNIDDSPYWVMTNSNTTRKKMMLHEVALELGYSKEQAETIRDYL
ncbi:MULTISPECIES: replication initiation negative regulator SeqA [unclassified Pseudoalteromonas]|uniref:replication initiation negative regulator SeqA n=1 Tax=unclassified Pseudoalteromonas TaxID=194690 RepID=UPI000CF6E8D3|nr:MULTISPECIES: replication initiation negative regulator SeqA [unclassified Pseudoalteromonas]MBS3796846.1 replication initiation negative regulator SeqA [Pseudoalteromonas sp. BDTF-M6]